ncbi:hypothetical protein HDV05_001925 [Chytridiales sp. JEL 0842]|nr:hypothetical protein HDV05_001925 [Chytridiales sp. JEL 0842]
MFAALHPNPTIHSTASSNSTNPPSANEPIPEFREINPQFVDALPSEVKKSLHRYRMACSTLVSKNALFQQKSSQEELVKDIQGQLASANVELRKKAANVRSVETEVMAQIKLTKRETKKDIKLRELKEVYAEEQKNVDMIQQQLRMAIEELDELNRKVGDAAMLRKQAIESRKDILATLPNHLTQLHVIFHSEIDKRIETLLRFNRYRLALQSLRYARDHRNAIERVTVTIMSSTNASMGDLKNAVSDALNSSGALSFALSLIPEISMASGFDFGKSPHPKLLPPLVEKVFLSLKRRLDPTLLDIESLTEALHTHQTHLLNALLDASGTQHPDQEVPPLSHLAPAYDLARICFPVDINKMKALLMSKEAFEGDVKTKLEVLLALKPETVEEWEFEEAEGRSVKQLLGMLGGLQVSQQRRLTMIQPMADWMQGGEGGGQGTSVSAGGSVVGNAYGQGGSGGVEDLPSYSDI